jgi:EAL domain-containing protein (putative c-di-GMP-specific phosphodiesterase class I)
MRIGLLTTLSAAMLLLAANYAHREIAIAFNRQSVTDLARNTLVRAEIATDYAVIRLGEIYQNGFTDCSHEAMEALNYAIFRSGSIKDILTAQGDSVCSVAMNRETLAQNHVNPVDGVAARNPKIVLNPLRMADTPAMAVTWNFDEETTATALVNTESLVFDVLPEELRETGGIRLSLTNGRTVGKFEGSRWQIGGDTQMFEFRSKRYPLVLRIHIPTVLLHELNMQTGITTKLAVAGLALLLSYFVARGLVPPGNASGRIHTALSRGEIVPHFQPVYNLRTGAMTGFEVLARWPKPDGSWVSPTVFVPLIEANGWSDDLLETMVQQVAQAMREMIETSPELKFAFNASPAQLADDQFCSRFLQILKRAEMDPGRVVLEITEREEISDMAMARQCIDQLATAGVAIAIDDAGTGHNGLATIRTLGAAVLKIDKFFVDGIESDPRTGTLIRMLVSVAHEYGMKVVAEGVEQGAQLTALAELGVDQVQGFYLCRPLDATEAKREYARHQAVLLRDRVRIREKAAAMKEKSALAAVPA